MCSVWVAVILFYWWFRDELKDRSCSAFDVRMEIMGLSVQRKSGVNAVLPSIDPQHTCGLLKNTWLHKITLINTPSDVIESFCLMAACDVWLIITSTAWILYERCDAGAIELLRASLHIYSLTHCNKYARLIDRLFYEVTGVSKAFCRRLMCWVSHTDEKTLKILRQQMEAELIYDCFNEDETSVSDLSSSAAPLRRCQPKYMLL